MKYGIFPRVNVKPGSNVAENGYFGITIDPKFPNFAAAIAEERREFSFKWQMLTLLSIPLVILFALLYYPLAPLGILSAAIILDRSSSFNREVERKGQSAFVSAAGTCLAIPFQTALDMAVASLTTNYSYFKGYDPELLRRELVQEMRAANKWVFDHLPVITKDIKRNV